MSKLYTVGYYNSDLTPRKPSGMHYREDVWRDVLPSAFTSRCKDIKSVDKEGKEQTFTQYELDLEGYIYVPTGRKWYQFGTSYGSYEKVTKRVWVSERHINSTLIKQCDLP